MTRAPENTKYGRCEATSKTTGERCGRAAIDERGKCGYHGGKTPLKNGIYSDVVREEDRPILDALEDLSTARKLEETLNLQIMKLRRAVEMMNAPDEEADFWAAFMDLVESAGDGGEIDPAVVRELTNMLDTPNRAQRELMDLIRKTAKDLHKITDGETVNVGVDEETREDLDELRETLEAAYGE